MATASEKPETSKRKGEKHHAPPSENAPQDKLVIHRPARVNLSREETRARMKSFEIEREETFVAAVREDAD